MGALSPDDVAAKVLRACREGTVVAVDGTVVTVPFESICIHSDTRGAIDLMTSARAALDGAHITVRSFADQPTD